MEEYKEPTTIKKEISDLDKIDSLARDIFYDRQESQPTSDDIARNILSVEEALAQLESDQKANVIHNLSLLQNLNGHKGADLRRIIASNAANNPEAAHLHALYQWSLQMAHSDTIKLEGSILQNAPGFLKDDDATVESIYQRILFSSKNPDTRAEECDERILVTVAQTLGLSPIDCKWIDIIDQCFNDPRAAQNRKALLEKVGFIPLEKMSRIAKKKMANIGGNNFTAAIEEMRLLEETESRDIARHERSRLINYLFISGNANSIRRQGQKNIALDTNGIFINARGFHSHLPYGLIDEQCRIVLERDNWITPQETTEIALRNAAENSATDERKKQETQQLRQFAAVLGIQAADDAQLLSTLTHDLQKDPDKYARQLIKRSLIIPDALLHYVTEKRDGEKLYFLVRLAESIGATITGERMILDENLFAHYELMDASQETYRERKKILSEPEYYNALKITRAILEQPVPNNPDNEFLAFRGKYKKSSEGNQHSFLEVLHQGHLARVLIDEHKHISRHQRKYWEAIPCFERAQFDTLENTLQTYNYFSSTLNRLYEIKERAGNNWQENFCRLSETCLHFLLSNVTGHHQAANNKFEQLKNGPEFPEQIAKDLLEIFENAHRVYSTFLHQNINTPENFQESFSPEIQKLDLTYGEEFLNRAKDACAPDGYNEEICRKSPPIRVCILNYKSGDPSETIPFHIEESCIDMIRIERNRPFIYVIGGCRMVEGSHEDPLTKLSQSILDIAHSYKANVGVPGTQSGLGNAFGLANIHYRNQTEHLPHNEKAHLIAISPGGNTFTPGNPYTEATNKDQVFAINAVDNILTPYPAGWELHGKDKYHSPYLNHVNCTADIFNRIAYDQPKIITLGNGGLYSIMDTTRPFQMDFDLMIVRNSGRFAEVLSAIWDHIDEIEQISDQPALSEKIIEIIKANIPEAVAQEFMKKDFGFEVVPENDDYEVYRSFLYSFLKTAVKKKDKISITAIDELEKDLRSYFEKKTRK